MASLIKALERGIMLSGALPVVFPTISLHESFAHPTSMYLRNLMSIDTEEMIKAQPIDVVVLVSQTYSLDFISNKLYHILCQVGGCDKV